MTTVTDGLNTFDGNAELAFNGGLVVVISEF